MTCGTRALNLHRAAERAVDLAEGDHLTAFTALADTLHDFGGWVRHRSALWHTRSDENEMARVDGPFSREGHDVTVMTAEAVADVLVARGVMLNLGPDASGCSDDAEVLASEWRRRSGMRQPVRFGTEEVR